ncbi:MAG: HNH endonuclease [Actinomycetota bacterium]|nr:HNH endonuclease [Actinomycetota bacterium]
MCTLVGELQEALEHLVAVLDPDDVPLPEAPGAWEAFAAIERLAGAAKTLLARRVEESRVWRRKGHRSAAEYLAAKAGAAAGAARAELEASKRLVSLPATETALRAGALSGPQVQAITDGASANRGAESRLLQQAGRASLAELRTECARARAAADADPDESYRRIRRARRLRRYCDAEGAWNLHARGPVDAGAQLEAALEPLVEERFRQARAAGEREDREAYAFDALVELARRARRGSSGAGHEDDPNERHQDEGHQSLPTYLMVLRADLEALVRGSVQGEEQCEIDGLGPVPVRTARALLGDSVLKLVLTRGSDVANVIHLGRGPTAAQRVALLWSQAGCTAEGCNRRWVEIDHRIPWAETRHTRLSELDALCPQHHSLKTHEGWALAEGAGKRPMVPPDDPRHPGSGRSCGRGPPRAS